MRREGRKQRVEEAGLMHEQEANRRIKGNSLAGGRRRQKDTKATLDF